MEVRQNHQNRPDKPYIHRGREIILFMTEAMIEAEAISDRDLMIKVEEDIFHSETNPEARKIQQDHTEEHIITEIQVTRDKHVSEVNPDPYQVT